jgi:hypothetical protein
MLFQNRPIAGIWVQDFKRTVHRRVSNRVSRPNACDWSVLEQHQLTRVNGMVYLYTCLSLMLQILYSQKRAGDTSRQGHSITVNGPSHRAPSTAFSGPERPPRLRWLMLRCWYSRMAGNVCQIVLRLSGIDIVFEDAAA